MLKKKHHLNLLVKKSLKKRNPKRKKKTPKRKRKRKRKRKIKRVLNSYGKKALLLFIQLHSVT
jgi:hypothetical protein